MITYKIILGYGAAVIGLIAYVPYLRDVFKGRTKPHAFSWFIWSLTSGIAFIAQLVEHGGAGAWVNGSTAIVCFFISLYAYHKGERGYTVLDWFSLVGSLLAIILWRLTNNPLTAVILVTITDALGFFPTFRKGYFKPFEETSSVYTLSAVKYVISLFALQAFSLTTVLFPVYLVVANALFVLLLIVKRKN